MSGTTAGAGGAHGRQTSPGGGLGGLDRLLGTPEAKKTFFVEGGGMRGTIDSVNSHQPPTPAIHAGGSSYLERQPKFPRRAEVWPNRAALPQAGEHYVF